MFRPAGSKHVYSAFRIGAAIACRRRADDMPFEDRLIDLDAEPEAAAADCGPARSGSWLLHHVP
jgi:GntR family histidine utilization transcriptional repressor